MFQFNRRVEIVAMTPLLIPEAKPVPKVKEGPAEGHKVFRTRRQGNSDIPLLPVTTLKGALRSAYEAVTNSRFGMFKGHDRYMLRRFGTKEARDLVPARVGACGTKFEVLNGRSGTIRTAGGQPKNLLASAWFNAYRWDEHHQTVYDTSPAYQAPAGAAETYPSHGDEVIVTLEAKLRDTRFAYWEAVPGTLHKATDPSAPAPSDTLPRRNIHVGNRIIVRGWVCITGANIETKHDERIFFRSPSTAGPTYVPLTDRHRESWRLIVEDYQRRHQDVIDERDASGERSDWPHWDDVHRRWKLAFSRHVLDANAATLAAGTLVYLDGHSGYDGVFPVLIGRDVSDCLASDLLDDKLKPAQSLDHLSPADRLFGWVREAQQGDSSNGTAKLPRPAAYKGQLRIAPVEYAECRAKGQDGNPLLPIATFGGSELPLAILSTPKPEQTRFYLGKRENGRVRPLRAGIDRQEAAYTRDKVLRGRKVYPHQAAMAGLNNYWQPGVALQDARLVAPANIWSDDDPRYREYVRRPQHNNTPLQDSQNRSIKDWIRPGAVFKAHIDVMNLNQAELGALLWLLDLPHFNRDPNNNEGRFFHRIGGGKPLGFGSVLIRLTSLDLADGCAKAITYGSLLPSPPTAVAKEHRAIGVDRASARAAAKSFQVAFRTAISTTYNEGNGFEEVSFIEAYVAAARGHAALPTHYPRTTLAPDPDGENFKWFVANEKEDGANGGLKLSLGALGSDASLPYAPTTSRGVQGSRGGRVRDR